jgi:kynurenine formamidase
MKYFDMSQELYHNCPGWPSKRLTTVNYEEIHGNNGVATERFDINVHTGTHLDAPFHFFSDGQTIDRLPLEAFIGRAHIVDLNGIAARTGIKKTHLEPCLQALKAGEIVLLRTGWCEKRSHSPEYYHDWPYLTKEGAEYLYERGVKGVGTDALSIGGWYEGTGRPPHEVLLGNGVWVVEELYFDQELVDYKVCNFTAVPLKLRDCSGSLTRAYATV